MADVLEYVMRYGNIQPINRSISEQTKNPSHWKFRLENAGYLYNHDSIKDLSYYNIYRVLYECKFDMNEAYIMVFLINHVF